MRRLSAVYVTGDHNLTVERARTLMNEFRRAGLFITHDWTTAAKTSSEESLLDWGTTGAERYGAMVMVAWMEARNEAIGDCDVLVVDLTERDDHSNAYDVGYALACGKKVIVVCGRHVGCDALADGCVRRTLYYAQPGVFAVRDAADAVRMIAAYNESEGSNESK